MGIDCERPTTNRNLLGIARRLFSPGEMARLLAASEAERPGLFIRFWTALEASVKLEGGGLFQPVAPGGTRPEIIHFEPQPGLCGRPCEPGDAALGRLDGAATASSQADRSLTGRRIKRLLQSRLPHQAAVPDPTSNPGSSYP